MTTKSNDLSSLRLIEGAKELSGNKCAEGFVYAGECRLSFSMQEVRALNQLLDIYQELLIISK